MAGSWPFTLRAPRCSDTFAFYYFCCILVPVVFAILGCISSPRVRKFDMVTIYPNFTSPSGLTRETLGIRVSMSLNLSRLACGSHDIYSHDRWN